jgi:hypothetical protein
LKMYVFHNWEYDYIDNGIVLHISACKDKYNVKSLK